MFVTRLVAGLSLPGRGDFVFVRAEFTALAVAFSVIMGLVVAVFEWRVPRAPRDTFMARLAEASPGAAPTLEVRKEGGKYLVAVAGGPRIRSTALLEAVRLKDCTRSA